MRTSIVLWSAFSGAVIGTFVDVVLIALALFAGAAAPALAFRLSHRWMGVAAAALLAAIHQSSLCNQPFTSSKKTVS